MEHGVLVSQWSLLMLKSHGVRTLLVLREEMKAEAEGREEGLSSPQAWPAFWQQSRKCRYGRIWYKPNVIGPSSCIHSRGEHGVMC